jgi:hypothetical protein
LTKTITTEAALDPAHTHLADVIAIIGQNSPAAALLDRAVDADCKGETAAWLALPLRYGPYCSTWVLPEHPLAPKKPGTE